MGLECSYVKVYTIITGSYLLIKFYTEPLLGNTPWFCNIMDFTLLCLTDSIEAKNFLKSYTQNLSQGSQSSVRFSSFFIFFFWSCASMITSEFWMQFHVEPSPGTVCNAELSFHAAIQFVTRTSWERRTSQQRTSRCETTSTHFLTEQNFSYKLQKLCRLTVLESI